MKECTPRTITLGAAVQCDCAPIRLGWAGLGWGGELYGKGSAVFFSKARRSPRGVLVMIGQCEGGRMYACARVARGTDGTGTEGTGQGLRGSGRVGGRNVWRIDQGGTS